MHINDIPKPEYPRPDRARENWLNLNGQWEFSLFPAGREADETAFAQARGEYARAITVPFSWVSPLSGVAENVAGIGWYRRRVSFDAAERLFLCFGAVDYLAEVFVNGARVGGHRGGYTPFELDVTDAWQKGRENVIEVRAEDYRRETQTFGKQGYGNIQGIWQTVWLEARPEARLESFRFETKCSGEIVLRAQTTAPDGLALAANFAGETHTAPVRNGAAEICFRIAHPRLWSPDDPYLYEGTLNLGADVVHTYFGVREIGRAAFAGRDFPWITLNGKPIYLNGTLDQAFNPQGHFTYPTDADMRMEAYRLKRLGLNMVRIHIKPEEPRKLYWMDKLGVLVMQDMPCFWGAPCEEAKTAYESEWPDVFARDYNHPSIFAWVMFNESWGLLTPTGEGDKRAYLPETQDWVQSVYRRAKAADPTRIVEDNSACLYDHVESDINTWHFYLNGYEVVRDHIAEVVNKTHPGSTFNYTGGRQQSGAPLMNSECGMVWGVDDSAGDSDIAWHYHYMLNEYRLHEKLCGFIFTEFHDVVNEFNGYYRIDDTDKDFGYADFCAGMTVADLHAGDFLATDCPPCQTVKGGETATVPLVLSSFADQHHETGLTLDWELWYDAPAGRVSVDKGARAIAPFGYGTTALKPLTLAMPAADAVAILSLYLKDAAGEVVSRNFVAFDVRGAADRDVIEVPVSRGAVAGSALNWLAQSGEKLCLAGAGEVSYQVELDRERPLYEAVVRFEAGAKRAMAKDKPGFDPAATRVSFMRTGCVDRGAFNNSYLMSDESRHPSWVEVLVNGECLARLPLQNDAADARGVLSWHMQPSVRKLDEAGSYGEMCAVRIPSRLLPQLQSAGGFTLTLRCPENGLALYGRLSGRYPQGLTLTVKG